MQLCIPWRIWQQMRGFCIASMPNEITGLGTIRFVNSRLFVNEIFVPDQVVSPGYCNSFEGAINEIIFDIVEDNPARAGNLRFRWHSHTNGRVFWSNEDEKDIANWDAPWVVNLVMNVQGDYLARIDYFDDGMHIKNIPLDVRFTEPIPYRIMQSCRMEVQEKTQPIPIYPDRPIPDPSSQKATSTAIFKQAAQALANSLPTKGGDTNAN